MGSKYYLFQRHILKGQRLLCYIADLGLHSQIMLIRCFFKQLILRKKKKSGCAENAIN